MSLEDNLQAIINSVYDRNRPLITKIVKTETKPKSVKKKKRLKVYRDVTKIRKEFKEQVRTLKEMFESAGIKTGSEEALEILNNDILLIG